MKSSNLFVLGLMTVFSLLPSAHGQILVNDRFTDGNRNEPATTYSEQGVDGDLDGDLESRWFGTTLTASAGHLVGSVGTGSSSWTTYFTSSTASSVNLANPGDMMRITWVFTPSTITNQNTSQGFRMAILQNPTDGSRLTTEATPPNTNYNGYAIFQNFAPMLGRANGDNLDIMERVVSNSDPLSSAANWTKRAGGGTMNNTGFVPGTQYTFIFTAQRTALGELQLNTSITGGTIDGTGTMSASFLDTSPNSFSFDMFAVRPSSASSSAGSFDVTQFEVELLVPEPTTATLLVAGLAGLALLRRQRRS